MKKDIEVDNNDVSEECRLFVGFPLRGGWSAVNTPADRIPSHGTDALGQRYAYDFIMTDSSSDIPLKFYRPGVWQYRTIGVKLNDCYCYGKPVYSPVSGQVVVVRDGVREPGRLHPLADFLKVVMRSLKIAVIALFLPAEKINLHSYTGNYVMIKFKDHYAFFAHLVPGSIVVSEGDEIKEGDQIGAVGHSGNSTAPHLHFHVMDSADLLTAKGIFCGFKEYRINEDGVQENIKNGVPSSDQIIAF